MRVKDLMTETVETCNPDTNLAEAASIMWRADCGAIPVVGDGGRVIGMITDRDIAVAAGTKNRIASDILVSEAMSHTVYYCTADEDIHAALKIMKKERVHRLPVVNSRGVIEGILSLTDIALNAEKIDGHKPTAISYEDVASALIAIGQPAFQRAITESRSATP